MSDPGPYPYVGKTITEVIHDYAVTRGDLSEPYARAQLVDLIERRIAQARREGAAEGAEAVRAAAQTLLRGADLPTPHSATARVNARALDDLRGALRGDA